MQNSVFSLKTQNTTNNNNQMMFSPPLFLRPAQIFWSNLRGASKTQNSDPTARQEEDAITRFVLRMISNQASFDNVWRKRSQSVQTARAAALWEIENIE